MLAFHFLYKLEKNLIPLLKHKTQLNKIILAIVLALIFPAFGEVITINLGVLIAFIVINKIVMGCCDKKGKGLRVASFVLECLSGMLVIICATLNSMKRNNNIKWID